MIKQEDLRQQVVLRCDYTHKVVWLDKPKKFREGMIVVLKGDIRRWEVLEKYTTLVPKQHLRQDWKVGGL